YLDTYLSALSPWLERDDVTDILINQPGEVWIETAGGMLARIAAPQVTEVALARLARQIAAASHQGVNREQPLLSATLPGAGRARGAAVEGRGAGGLGGQDGGGQPPSGQADAATFIRHPSRRWPRSDRRAACHAQRHGDRHPQTCDRGPVCGRPRQDGPVCR